MGDERAIRYHFLAGEYSCTDCAHELGSSEECDNCIRARVFTLRMMALVDRWLTPSIADGDAIRSHQHT